MHVDVHYLGSKDGVSDKNVPLQAVRKQISLA
jgi:hypothetical protein